MNSGATRRGRTPLEGVRVLAIEQMQALPYGTQMLSRLGADVVKIEHPQGGESGRASLPSMADPYGRPVGATFLRNNLGKRSVGVDLKDPRGLGLVLRLAARFDIVCENFKAGTADRLGIGYDAVSAVNNSVIYLSVSGSAISQPAPTPVGPPTHQLLRQWGASMSSNGNQVRRRIASPVGSLGDTASSLYAVIGVLARAPAPRHDG